jgi:spore maturation protein CgeB
MYVADGLENPFIHGAERTKILNRTVITLNVQSERRKNILPMRFVLAAGNRSFVLSDPALSHTSEILDGEHYVTANSRSLVNKILYYLDQEKERHAVVQKAFDLCTTRLTMANSLRILLDKVHNYRTSILSHSS